MVKAVLFDADGVILKKGKYKYFSERFSTEHNVPAEKILPFFKNEYRLCSTNQSDLKEILPPYLKQWGWQGSLDDFLQYWFASDCEIDANLLKIIEDLRAKGVLVCLATNNEKYRAEYLLKTAKLEDVFDKAFVSAYIGYKKPTPEFFNDVMKELGGISKDEVLFWDSDEKVVEGAKEYGIQSKYYTSFEDFEKQMKDLNLV